jgi:hypothetical protein
MQKIQSANSEESPRCLQAMPAALAIRLRRNASFQEKPRQLIVKMLKEKAPASGRFPKTRMPRLQQF